MFRARATMVRIFRREGDLPKLGFLSELRLGMHAKRLSCRRMNPGAGGGSGRLRSESAFIARVLGKRYGSFPVDSAPS